MKFSIFAVTNSGLVRTHNEDDFAVCKDLQANDWSFKRGETTELSDTGALMVVADGMGGTNAGEVAANLAQLSVKEKFESVRDLTESVAEREEFLKKLILDAHKRVVEHQHNHLDTAGMGTTLVVSWVIENVMHVAWSGDSRCYLYSEEDGLKMVTQDHSMIWEMVKAGKMSAEEARVHPESNVITQSLGTEGDPPKPESVTIALAENDRVLLCSDGLNGMVSDQDIERILQKRTGVADTCHELVKAANEAGGEDNITCTLMDIIEGPKRGEKRDLDDTLIIKPKKSLFSKLFITALLAAVLIGGTYFVLESTSKSTNGEGLPVDPGTSQQDLDGSDEPDSEGGSNGDKEPGTSGEVEPGVESRPTEAEPGESELNQTYPPTEVPVENEDRLNTTESDSLAKPVDLESVLPEKSDSIRTTDSSLFADTLSNLRFINSAIHNTR
ncbi:MAG: serine/threonine-protein phosphatase [Balneolaceae bacterium]|nr:serine/threonine-protein phosphatase [Balneolaceae bacterium]MCH8549537.1 protein phosphatase 2C domain-containing protein [Balneolaceae bacterium]